MKEAPGIGEAAAPAPSRASHVAVGILASRLLGLVRDRAIAHYFGLGGYADVFRTALRGPNVLQNLLGEGTISAAFIPVYTRLLHEGRPKEAGRLAGAVFALLLCIAAALSLVGVLAARPIVAVFVPGFLLHEGLSPDGVNRYELAVSAVRIIFPMTGLLVLSAWALGVLNSHRRFLVPYLAPVFWNASIIAALVFAAGGTVAPRRLLLAACWGALVGGGLQFAVQLPFVFRVLRGFVPSFSWRLPGVREVVRAVGPVIAGRGVYQLSAYLDLAFASLLAEGAVAAMGCAVMLYVLPVSLFGMSVAAAELPELSRDSREGLTGAYRRRVRGSLAQMAFLIVPTALGYLAFGYLIVGGIYRSGRFSTGENALVYLVLAGYSLGLLATTWSRLLQNAFFALGETITPARVAFVRVAVSAATAVPLMLVLDRYRVGAVFESLAGTSDLHLGALGLSLGSAAGAWTELLLLRRWLVAKTGGGLLPWSKAGRMTAVALLSMAVGAGAWMLSLGWHVVLQALVVVGSYGLVYLILARLAGLGDLSQWLSGIRGRRPGA